MLAVNRPLSEATEKSQRLALLMEMTCTSTARRHDDQQSLLPTEMIKLQLI